MPVSEDVLEDFLTCQLPVERDMTSSDGIFPLTPGYRRLLVSPDLPEAVLRGLVEAVQHNYFSGFFFVNYS